MAKREIIVRFRPGGFLEMRGPDVDATHVPVDDFNDIVRIRGLLARLSFPRRIARLGARTAAPASRPPGRAGAEEFIRIRVPEGTDAASIARELSSAAGVDYAIVAPVPARPPQVDPPTPSLVEHQEYLTPYPYGVDVHAAWAVGGDGTGVTICVCDFGYRALHEDLSQLDAATDTVVPLVQPVNLDPGPIPDGGVVGSDSLHGTNVLGVLVASSNGLGLTGMCHGATALFALAGNDHPAAIDAAIDALQDAGGVGVLVIELQTRDTSGVVRVPREYIVPEDSPDIRSLIRDAAEEGITTVSAAANGGTDLATVAETRWVGGVEQIIYPWAPGGDYDDSGAIMVGSGSVDTHSRRDESNWGDRVDCQGWGSGVATTGGGLDGIKSSGGNVPANEDQRYTDKFGDTSSATAMVAGIVSCLQSALVQNDIAPLDPGALRLLLRDPASGHAQGDDGNPATERIGPLPDLRRILEAQDLPPAEVYVRDAIEETPDSPRNEAASYWSPDIILRGQRAVDPNATFGAAVWNQADLGDPIEPGHDHFIYTRLQNRGLLPGNVVVSIYWSKPSTFLHPSYWHPIGSVHVANVVAGQQRVIGPAIWGPRADKVCLIAVVNSIADPLSIPDSNSSSMEFLSFQENHGSIRFRNVQLARLDQGQQPAKPFEFLLRGLHDRNERFTLKLHHRLPPTTKIRLRIADQEFPLVPVAGRRKVFQDNQWAVTSIRGGMGEIVIVDLPLLRGQEMPVSIRVRLPGNSGPGQSVIHVDQFLGDRRLGRVNCLIQVG